MNEYQCIVENGTGRREGILHTPCSESAAWRGLSRLNDNFGRKQNGLPFHILMCWGGDRLSLSGIIYGTDEWSNDTEDIDSSSLLEDSQNVGVSNTIHGDFEILQMIDSIHYDNERSSRTSYQQKDNESMNTTAWWT